ncbi:MAG: DNA mismatch repair protein MutL, partial [Proteobacteria bacterium]|nr:DNA mismatch repair protein MutL [Pseudomonadota bacterium]
MEVVSRQEHSETANRLIVHGGKEIAVEEWRGSPGTIVDASELFYSIPARKKFLKRASAETTMCVKTFLEKALPFPEISFRLYTDNKMKLFLPASDLKNRILSSWKGLFNPTLLQQISGEEEGFKITIVAGRPEQNRKDRRYIQIFANNRRIDEYSFVQAVQYGYNDSLPGGVFPVCFVFIEVDSNLVDFNIHPAKREARFRNQPAIHHKIVEMIKEFLSGYRFRFKSEPQEVVQETFSSSGMNSYSKAPSVAKKTTWNEWKPPVNYRTPQEIKPDNQMGSVSEKMDQFAPIVEKQVTSDPQQTNEINYLGQIMDLFLVAEYNNRLFVIDQHAAHERILYEEYKRSASTVQELLIPIEFEADEGEEQ